MYAIGGLSRWVKAPDDMERGVDHLSLSLSLYLTGAVLVMMGVWGYGMELMQERVDPGLARVPRIVGWGITPRV